MKRPSFSLGQSLDSQDKSPLGVYIGDGIYLRGADEPQPYGPTVRVNGRDTAAESDTW